MNLLYSEIIKKTDIGNRLLSFAEAYDIEIVFDRDLEVNGESDLGGNTITINDLLPKQEKIITLVHELRHFWQQKRNCWPSFVYDIEDYLSYVKVCEADAETTSVAFCNQMMVQ